MKVIWLGQNGLLFVSGKNKVLVDPYLTDTLHELDARMERGWSVNRRFLDISPDVIILTNSHLDHLDIPTLRSYIEKNREQRTLLCCESAFEVIADTGIVGRYNNVLFDEGYEWTHDNLHIKAVRAYSDDRTAIGIIITDTSEDKKYYITSDTLYNEKIFASLPDDIDTVFLPVNGEDGCMNMYDAERFAKKVGAVHTVPVHFGMFDDVNPAKFKHDGAVVPTIYKIIPLEDDENAKRRRMSLRRVFADEEKNMKQAEAKKAEKADEPVAIPVEVKPTSVEVEPIPVAVNSEPVEIKPVPVAVSSESVEVKPAPVAVKPTPIEVKPEPVEVKPTPIEVKPTSVEVKPVSVEVKPEPIEIKPIPVAVNSEPVEVKPTPVADSSESVEVKPAPVAVKPAPVEENSVPVVEKPSCMNKPKAPEPIPNDEPKSYNRAREISGKRSTLWKEVAKLSDKNGIHHVEDPVAPDSREALWERLDQLASEPYDDGFEENPYERFIEDEETLSSKSCLWEEIAKLSGNKEEPAPVPAEAKPTPVESKPLSVEPVKEEKTKIEKKDDFFVEIIEDDEEEEIIEVKPQFSENDIMESDFIVEEHADVKSLEDIDKELLYFEDSIADGFSDDPYEDDGEDDVSDQIDAYIKELENFERGDTVDFDRAELKK